jgi:arginase
MLLKKRIVISVSDPFFVKSDRLLDLDVLDVNKFHALYFGKPDAPEGAFDGIAQGRMTMQQVVRLLADVSQIVDVVGLGITEHLPWDAIELKNMLARLPLIGER